jgi:hypothetical protein
MRDETTLLAIALHCIRRGWHVFPLKPRAKEPLIHGGFKSASLSDDLVRAWWTKWPDANVGIATGASGLSVLDIDTGLDGWEAVELFCTSNGIPADGYIVRTGRRPGFGVQLYFQGGGLKSIPWSHEGVSGDIRSATGYIVAAGCPHPSGAFYTALVEAPIASEPAFVRELRSAAQPTTDAPDERITEHRNTRLTSIAGKLRNAGLSAEALEVALLAVNAERCAPPLDDVEVSRIAANASRWNLPEPDTEVTIGKPKAPELDASEPVDWRTRYMTEDAYSNVKPPVFIIDGFLVQGSVAMLAGPVAQRKSIIALNIAHALCTKEPLFGFFDVKGGHERVVYLCPEMGAASFVKRVKQIGLSQYIGKSLFIQTMSEATTALDQLDGELPGAVVIVDTITRFIEGDENKSADMRLFAAKVFRLMNAGATVVLLHHSKKGSSGSLDDGLRGSSELAAFVDSCWVTELADPTKPYESLSKMRNVKQRDFESDPFKLKPTLGSYYLSMDGEPAPEAALKSKADDAATEALRKLLLVDPKMGVNRLRDALKAVGHGKGQKWVMAARLALLGGGTTLTEAIPHTPSP